MKEFVMDYDETKESLDDDEENGVDLSIKADPKDIDRSVLEPMKIKPLKLPKSIEEDILKSFEFVCVQDFKDMYHMTEEERKEKMQFYEVFRELRQMKIKHRTLNTFVLACRAMVKCLKTVADSNGVYDPIEFMKLVSKKKIKVSGLKIPKYIGRGKKYIDWNVIVEYITDESLNVDDLAVKKNEAFWDVPTEEDMDRLEKELGMSPIEYIQKVTNESNLDEEEMNDVYIGDTDYTGKNIVRSLSKQENKELLKDNGRAILNGFKSIRKTRTGYNGNSLGKTYAFELSQDAFDEIKSMDDDRKTGKDGIPKFKGNAMKKKDIDVYLAKLDEYERQHEKVQIDGRWYTLEEAEEIDLKNTLDKNGLDIRKFYSYKEDNKRALKQKKREQKKIKMLKKKLTAAKKRYEERDSGGRVNTKKKKGKGKKATKNLSRVVDSYKDYIDSMED